LQFAQHLLHCQRIRLLFFGYLDRLLQGAGDVA
jgi:hypothetical protein